MRIPKYLLLTTVILFLPLSPAWALQEHPAPEGLIAHQIAHLFFMGAMLLFIYRLKKTGLAKRPHWGKLRWAALILAVWNIWAFCGHLVSLRLDPQVFMPPLGPITHYCQAQISVQGLKEVLYIVFKNDNVLTLAAFFLIYSAVNKMERLLRGKE